MDFLKDVLGDGYADFESKVNAYNEANKDKAIKLANLTGGGYVSKDKFATIETEANGYKTQLSELNTQIETLKKTSGTSEELKAQFQSLQDKYNGDTEALNKQIADIKFNSALEIALASSGAKSTKALKGFLEMEKIKLDGDNLIGFDEQLKAIKEENDYLFGESTSTNTRTGGRFSQSGGAPGTTVQEEIKNQIFGK